MKQPFEQIVAEHGETVLRVCRVVVGVVDADDAWSETFLSALRAYPDLPADANVQAWLVTIAHRRAVDVIRSEVARHRREQLPPEPDHSSVEEEALAGSVAEVVRAALDRLPAEEREPIALAYLRGLTYVEVARHLGKPEGTVKSRIRSGMRHLSKILADSV